MEFTPGGEKQLKRNKDSSVRSVRSVNTCSVNEDNFNSCIDQSIHERLQNTDQIREIIETIPTRKNSYDSEGQQYFALKRKTVLILD